MNTFKTTCIIYTLTLTLYTNIGFAQYLQQGNKLVASDTIGSAEQGYAVALSSDGNTLLVGGPHDNNYVGATWVYTRTAGLWSKQVKLIGTGAITKAYQGSKIALSGDGNTAVIAGPCSYNLSPDSGIVWIFHRNSSSSWTQDTLFKKVGASAVAISADGNTLAIGNVNDSSQVGHVIIYLRNGTTWIRQGKKVYYKWPTTIIECAGQGSSVALSSDGRTLIEGAGNGLKPNAWIFNRDATDNWVLKTDVRTFNTTDFNATSGLSGIPVAISGDGSIALVGTPGLNNLEGGIQVYRLVGSNWSFQSKYLGSGTFSAAPPPSKSSSQQGFSLAISLDGTTFAEGGDYDSAVGASWIFKFISKDSCVQYGKKIIGSGYQINHDIFQGYSVALSSNGSTLAMGGMADNNYSGATWVFTNGAATAIHTDKTNEYFFEVYPNPGNGHFNIFSKNAGLLNIYNITGQKVLTRLLSAESIDDIDLMYLPKGVYYAHFAGNNKVFGKKIFIE